MSQGDVPHAVRLGLVLMSSINKYVTVPDGLLMIDASRDASFYRERGSSSGEIRAGNGHEATDRQGSESKLGLPKPQLMNSIKVISSHERTSNYETN